jgi:hypothetical protein
MGNHDLEEQTQPIRESLRCVLMLDSRGPVGSQDPQDGKMMLKSCEDEIYWKHK